jgi:elongation factor G
MHQPELVILVAIEPKSLADRDHLAQGLRKLMAEDPTFRVTTGTRTGETILLVASEEQIDAIAHRLEREFNVRTMAGEPRAAHKETLTRPAEGEGRYARQTAGRGEYGHARIRVLPASRGSGYTFENQIADGAIPEQFIKSIAEGIQDALTSGVLGGYPVDDVRVELYEGSYHDVDSSETAFRIAGSMAFRDAAKKADPVLLEPIMSVEVRVPEEYIGDVIDDISSRRGHIEGMELVGARQIIRAKVPLSEMFGYANDVRSRTGGGASYSMKFDRYEILGGGADGDDEDRGAPVSAPRPRGPSGKGSGVGIPEPN